MIGKPVDGDIKVELAFCRLDLGNVDMEVADRVVLELFLRRLVAREFRQAWDTVPLQTAMQR